MISSYFNDSLFFGQTVHSITGDPKKQIDTYHHSANNRYDILLNGEIYNHYELRKELTEYKFKSNSDTETLLYLFIKYGPDCLQKLDGMFAVAIYNKRTKMFFFAKDRAGKKPLYYYNKNNQFFFARELNTLNEIDLILVSPG